MEEAGEASVDVFAAEAAHLAGPLLPLFDDARLAEDAKVVGAGRFGDRRGEAAAGARGVAGGQFGDDAAALRVAQRVEDGGKVDRLAVGVLEIEVFGSHLPGNDTTIVEPFGTVII